MSTKKKNYFTVAKLDKLSKDNNADYIFLVGARNNGKSYSVKSRCLQDAYNSIKNGVCEKQLGYIRRFTMDCKDSICEKYFADMPIQELTNNEYTHISIYRKEIFFAVFENDKIVRKIKIGDCFALGAAEHYKSLMYPKLFNLIYEEVVSESGKYLYHESDKLLHLISTLFRDRTGKVYLIGNQLTPICPYYNDWNLNIDKLDFGQSNIIRIREGSEETVIVVHKTEPLDYNDKMFFGRIKKNIVGGEYITDIYPIIDKSIRHFNILYTMVMQYDNFKYTLYFFYNPLHSTHMWYIEPKTTAIKPGVRLITNQNVIGKKVTRKLQPLAPAEQKIFAYLHDHTKVCFSDNLTGTVFNNLLDNF